MSKAKNNQSLNSGCKDVSEITTGCYNKYVTKYKRTKNLVKKCAEISKQSNIDIVLILYDQCSMRLREYHTSEEMTLPKILKTMTTDNFKATFKHERFLTRITGTDRNLETIEQEPVFDTVAFQSLIKNHERKLQDLTCQIREVSQEKLTEGSPRKESLSGAEMGEPSLLDLKVGSKRQLTNTSVLLPEQNLFKQPSSASSIIDFRISSAQKTNETTSCPNSVDDASQQSIQQKCDLLRSQISMSILKNQLKQRVQSLQA